MGLLDKVVTGLVEADVAVAADAQQLEIHIAPGADIGVVVGAEGSGVLCQAVGHPGVLRENVHVVKEVALHEIAVALVVVGGQAHILVQVDGAHVLKAKAALFIPVHQILVGPLGGGAGGQAQQAGGVVGDLRGDDLSGPAAHSLVVFLTIDSHDTLLLPKILGQLGFKK